MPKIREKSFRGPSLVNDRKKPSIINAHLVILNPNNIMLYIFIFSKQNLFLYFFHRSLLKIWDFCDHLSTSSSHSIRVCAASKQRGKMKSRTIFFNFILINIIPCVVLMNRSQNYTKRDPKLNTKTCKCVSLCLILPSKEKKERQLRAKKNNENLFSCFAMCLHSILSEWNRENASAINCEQRQKSK